MGVGAFTDKHHKPSTAEIHQTIGAMLDAWRALKVFIRETYTAEESFVFLYGSKYGWATQFRVRKKLLVSLYPTAGGFTVQIILKSDAVERARKMRLGANVWNAIARAKPYAEGRWLFIPVMSMEDVAVVQRLLALKVEAGSER